MRSCDRAVLMSVRLLFPPCGAVQARIGTILKCSIDDDPIGVVTCFNVGAGQKVQHILDILAFARKHCGKENAAQLDTIAKYDMAIFGWQALLAHTAVEQLKGLWFRVVLLDSL